MKRTPVSFEPNSFPQQFHPLLADGNLFDSSCSNLAKVWFIDKGDGFYLKSAPKGSLKTEAEMTAFFHSKGLASEVLSYVQEDTDWLLTARVPGEDCTHAQYLDDPKRLCETTATLLRSLHETDAAGCPVSDHTKDYLATAERNFRNGLYDLDGTPFHTPEEAWSIVQEYAGALRTDTLLHGDYCLPNIMLDNWKFTGFIDLDHGGIGDRHIDLFWGIWTLGFNLKTDAYRDRFLDAYGTDKIDMEILNAISAFEVFG